jgi:oligopeptide/dipeptide ABC transporter ATP-binding protein
MLQLEVPQTPMLPRREGGDAGGERRFRREMADFDEIIETCTRKLQAAPNHLKALFLRGSAFYKKRAYDEAIADLTAALALEPKVIVADEPVSALDVSIQAQILNLLAQLTKKMNLTLIFIAHDLSVVKHISDRVAVMYLGKIVELGLAADVIDHPRHPYTRALVSAIPTPNPDIERTRQRIVLAGDPPSPINPPAGCAFHPRCAYAQAQCKLAAPPLVADGPSREVACIRLRDIP